MNFRGFDNTFGAPSLIACYKDVNGRADNELKQKQLSCAEEFISTYNKSWLLRLLCEYNGTVSIYDAMWFSFIKRMLFNKTLYLTLIELPRGAYPDKEMVSNYKLLEDIGINCRKVRGNSDGVWEYKSDLVMMQLGMNDEDCANSVKEEITVSNPFGICEFGYQPICKSAMSLSNNEFLLRVPYQKIDNTNFAAILFNSEPLNIDI